ncbi:MAG: hypothetical protein ACI9R3_004603 [Verrucomicrobiales bacterium]|jgi:hypothetical protein
MKDNDSSCCRNLSRSILATMTLLTITGMGFAQEVLPIEPSETLPGEVEKIDGESLIRSKMQLFRAYEGEWEGTQSYAEAEGNPAYESKGGWIGQFRLNGMFFEMDGHSTYESGESSYRWMITYDVSLGKYRAWTFNSNGIVTDWLGFYDETHKTLVWRFVDPTTGIRGWLRTQTQPNLVTGQGMAKTDGAGVLSDYRLKFKRKKLRI